MAAPFSDAEAKRFGGGRSFGGKSFYSNPYRRSQASQRPSQARQKAVQHNQAARQSWRHRGGMLGRLAPFLIGGLLGYLFLGGAFEHLNIADMLIFGGLAFLAFKLLTRRPQPAPEPPYGYRSAAETPRTSDFRNTRKTDSDRPFDTDILFGKGKAHPDTPVRDLSMVNVPPGFDLSSFLREAKQRFLELQEAWNRGEMAEIRGLTTDAVFMEIKEQRDQQKNDLPTDVLELEAQLLDYHSNQDTEETAVLFTAFIEEGERPPERIQEIWHFVRSTHHFRPKWLLDGIQQFDS